jgi:hypothetical protein
MLIIRRDRMPKKKPEDFEYLSNNPEFVPDPEIEEFMEEEISRAPKDPELLARRMRSNNGALPAEASGDPDADEVGGEGTESFHAGPIARRGKRARRRRQLRRQRRP